jgi:hypothetical protein
MKYINKLKVKICLYKKTLRVPLVEQDMLPFRSTWVHPGFSWVRVSRSLVLCVCFVDRYLSFCSFSFGNYIVCPYSIDGFWFPLWYLQTFPQLPQEYLNNPKGASFKENHLTTTAHDALRTTFIFRFRTLTNNLNFLNRSKHVWNDMWL